VDLSFPPGEFRRHVEKTLAQLPQDAPSRPVIEGLLLPDDWLGVSALWWWIVFVAEKKGISAYQITFPVAFQIVRATPSFTCETDLALEVIIHILAGGDFMRGGRLFRDYMAKGTIHAAAIDEWMTGRRRQRATAKKPKPNALRSLVNEIVSNSPQMTYRELITHLDQMPLGGIIDNVDRDRKVVCWRNKEGNGKKDRESSFKSLYRFLADAKKSLKSP